MRPRYRNLLAAVFLASVLILVWQLQDSEATTTVLLVTSAERQDGDSASLSNAGRARAEALSRLAGDLADPGLLAGIFSAGGEPERETVRVLSERLDEPITDMLIEDPAAFARGLARQHRGKIVIISGRHGPGVGAVGRMGRRSPGTGGIRTGANAPYQPAVVRAAPNVGPELLRARALRAKRPRSQGEGGTPSFPGSVD